MTSLLERLLRNSKVSAHMHLFHLKSLIISLFLLNRKGCIYDIRALISGLQFIFIPGLRLAND